ncbi:hypothetical protein BDY24DRAFT_203634 [Mrakia frigida]|uniref:uncharacterized protein n=1 Tax=Mrakia frigida TaxID=29902 RepID=UPI003FCC0354
MSWAESPNVFGKLASFTEDTIAWKSVAAQASLVGLPREILLKIASFLPPGRKKHAHRGRYGFEVLAKDLLSLSSSCSGLYIFFRPLRFRSLSLGGDNRSLAYARLIAEDLDASRLVCELEITSLCPNHEELSEPYAELISKVRTSLGEQEKEGS